MRPLILHTQAESSIINHQYGAYSRDSSRLPRRRPLIYLNHHALSGQSRVYRVTQLRVNGVHCRESAGTGSVGLKVVPVTGATTLQVTMDQLMCASLFPHIHHWHEVGTYQPVITISARVEFHLHKQTNIFLAHPSQFIFFRFGRLLWERKTYLQKKWPKSFFFREQKYGQSQTYGNGSVSAWF